MVTISFLWSELSDFAWREVVTFSMERVKKMKVTSVCDRLGKPGQSRQAKFDTFYPSQSAKIYSEVP
jgi:hypothetical protein